MSALIKRLRPINLLILAAIQCIYYLKYFSHKAANGNVSDSPDRWHISALIGVTILLASSGYLINDYFDQSGDRINRKHNADIPAKTLLYAYFLILTFGLIICFVTAVHLQLTIWSGLYLIAALLLFLYSSHLQGCPLVGNIVVALFCASILPIIFFLELSTINDLHQFNEVQYEHLCIITIVFSVFIFLMTLIRELIKDVEDLEGDKAAGLKTYPVVHGINRSKVLVIFYTIVLFFCLVFVLYYFPAFRQNRLSLIGAFILLTGFAIIIFQVARSRNTQNFGKISLSCKLVMILGILYLLLI